MANTTLGNLKINALRRCGNYYNANDSALLSLTGGLINDALSQIYSKIKKTPYCYDIGNTVNTVASQAYIALADTDIIQILQVYQKVTDTKLLYIPYEKFVSLAPDTTAWAGTPEVCWSATQAIDITGQNIWTLWFLPTPSSAVAIYYDYLKNIQFAAGAADSVFCPLPTIFDRWIYAEFKPLFYEVIAPKDSNRILTARQDAIAVREEFSQMIRLQAEEQVVMESFQSSPSGDWNVKDTPAPP